MSIFFTDAVDKATMKLMSHLTIVAPHDSCMCIVYFVTESLAVLW
jgi:hypothetical protein